MAGSTNFLQFNPTQANQETDAEYAVDTTRTGGAGVGAEWPSNSANKTLYQGSTFYAAFAQMMANKNFVMSDANLGTLTAVLANVLTTADIPGGLDAPSWSSSMTLDTSAYSTFQITLGGNTTLSLVNAVAGQSVVVIFVQDATGGHTITFPSGTVGGAQPDPTANAVSAQLFKIDAALNLIAQGPNVGPHGMGGLPVGAVNAAAGNFTTLQLNGTAPNGQVLVGNGTSYVPAAAPGYTSGNNVNGYWQKNPTGLIRQWGHVTTDINGGTLAVTFPTNFTNINSVVVNVSTLSPTDRITYVVDGSVSLGGFTIGNNGSSGYAYWEAVGY